MAIKVGLLGNTRLAKRLADAIATQSDMCLLGVSGKSNPVEQVVLRRHEAVESTEQWASVCDVLIDARGTDIHIINPGKTADVASSPAATVFTCLATPQTNDSARLVIPGADVVALARIVKSLREVCQIERLYTTIVRRAAHASDAANASLDALEPVVGRTDLDGQLEMVFANVIPRCQARGVIASYTHSNFQMLKFDVAGAVDREAVVASLKSGLRILLCAARDGFRSTADLNEHFRDIGRRRGDRWEACIWDESIFVLDQGVYMMMDVSLEAAPIPEALDAVRMMAQPNLEMDLIRRLTDQSLGILPSAALLIES